MRTCENSATLVIRSFVIALALLGAHLKATAANPVASDGELAQLPPYCLDMDWGNRVKDRAYEERRAVWRSRLGASFDGLHHYCWGLLSAWKAGFVANKDRRNFMLQGAVGDYDYAITNSQANFVLLPELFLRKGEALALVERFPEALASFETAWKLKPDYWPPYLKAAEIYERLKLNTRALDVLGLGLQSTPTQPELLERFRTLGGRRPLPTAPGAAAPAPAASAAASAASSAETR